MTRMDNDAIGTIANTIEAYQEQTARMRARAEKAERELEAQRIKHSHRFAEWHTQEVQLKRELADARDSWTHHAVQQLVDRSETAESERDEARLALKAIGACPTFDCDDCRELLEVALREVKE